VKDARLEALGAHVAEQQDRLRSGSGNEATRRQLAQYVADRAESRQGSRGRFLPGRRVWMPLALSALMLLALFGARGVLWPALAFQVGSAAQPSQLPAWASAPAGQPLPIRFSDGTQIELAPETRARVVAVGRAGAELVLESGRARVDVMPARRWPGESPWRIDSGPFSVVVKGTRFEVAWDPRAGEFALDLFEGTVSVEGCGRDTAVQLVAGQGVRASCAERRWSVAPLAELVAQPAVPPEPAAPQGEGPEHPLSTPAVVEPTPLPPATSAPRQRRSVVARSHDRARPAWSELARQGRHVEAYASAERAGFEAVCERAGAADVLLLGDVARLAGEPERAARAYGAVRRRFSGTPSAARAAFALGRLRVETDRAGAERWFDTYVREEPSGPLVQAAHDWLFELALSSGDSKRQQARARSYLDLYPTGAHAEDARRLLERLPPAR
jgi:hypothetical protein